MPSFKSESILLGTMFAKVVFRQIPGQDITVEVFGDEEMVQQLSISCEDGRLDLRGALPGVVIKLGNYSIFTTDDDIVVNGVRLDSLKRLEVQIGLPDGSEVTFVDFCLGEIIFSGEFTNTKIENASPNWVEGDVFSDLELVIVSSGGFSAKQVTNLTAKLHDSGSADIDLVLGTIDAKVVGLGDLSIKKAGVSDLTGEVGGSATFRIDQGSITNLVLEVDGGGCFNFDGTVTNADLMCSGVGDIFIDVCTNKPQKVCNGMGDIQIYDKVWKKK